MSLTYILHTCTHAGIAGDSLEDLHLRRRLRYALLINNRENKSTEECIKGFFFQSEGGK